jgi:hypothetical protein
VASELQRLTLDPAEAMAWPELARIELATCARGGTTAHCGGTVASASARRRLGFGAGAQGEGEVEAKLPMCSVRHEMHG